MTPEDTVRFRLPREELYQAPDPTLEPVMGSVFPDGATMFYCIGAQKAGTTWLHDYLGLSPQVHFSRNKELHYFDVGASRAGMALRIRVNQLSQLAAKLNLQGRRLNRNIVEHMVEAVELLTIYTGGGDGAGRHRPYLKYLFQDWQGAPVAGDITPSYSILDAEHFVDMASIGQAKFVFLLRDPVARMWSHIRMGAGMQLAADAGDDLRLQACRDWAQKLIDKNELETVRRGDYQRTMTELERAVPTDRILYVFYEDLFTGKATAQICAFLGIPEMPVDADRRVNEGVRLDIPEDLERTFRTAYDRQYTWIRDRFGAAVPTAWRD